VISWLIADMAYPSTKFKDSSFSRSKDMKDGPYKTAILYG